MRAHSPNTTKNEMEQRMELETGWEVRMSGWKTHPLKVVMLVLLSIPLLGLPLLIAFKWSVKARIALTGQKCRLKEASWLVVTDPEGDKQIVPLRSVNGRDGSAVIRVAEYRHVRLVVDEEADRLVLVGAWKDPSWVALGALRQPLSQHAVHHRELYFGPNLINVDTKSLGRLLLDEVLHPFYVFQWASIILWSLDDYFVYAAVLFVMSVGAIVSSLVETRRQLLHVERMARFVCDVRVQRGTTGEWLNLTSDRLVPGDVVDLSSITGPYPCDVLLVSGDVIVNEAMLTGESVPAFKRPVTHEALVTFDPICETVPAKVAKHMLFAGTRPVRVRAPMYHDAHPSSPNGNGPVAYGVVARTGFNTTKGQLVRSMLFPRPVKVSLYRDAFHFILLLTVLAFAGFVFTFVNFIRHKVPYWRIVVRALDLITVAVPPALPLTVQVGAAFALSRLRKQGIRCSAPTRINLAGKLDLVVYDKTGTLTEDGLAVLGVRGVQPIGSIVEEAEVVDATPVSTTRFSELCTQPGSGHAALKRVMAACTDVAKIRQLWIGDPLEVESLRWTRWQHEELPPSAGKGVRGYLLAHGEEPKVVVRPAGSPARAQVELAVLKWFDFDPDIRCMSVLARATAPARDLEVHCKGAPEAIRTRCRPESIPQEFDRMIDDYTRHGYRVIAYASKTLAAPESTEVIVSAADMTREQAESNLEFQGLVVFENRLKPSTTGVVIGLCDARVRQVVCTGDAPLTAVSVARECGIIASLATVYAPQRDDDGRVEWVNTDRPQDRMRTNDLRMRLTDMNGSDTGDALASNGDGNHSSSGMRGNKKSWLWGKRSSILGRRGHAAWQEKKEMEMQDVRAERESMWVLAVTGDTFQEILASGDDNLINHMLIRGQVFARMSPDQKRTLVELFRDRLGYRPAYCGDGANDCSALKAADVGIALSQAEASAAAPFTSQQPDIRCVPTVIREGRAALVTSIACFKYMALYSLIQFTTLTLVYSVGRALGNGQFLFIDLIIVLPIALLCTFLVSIVHLHHG